MTEKRDREGGRGGGAEEGGEILGCQALHSRGACIHHGRPGPATTMVLVATIAAVVQHTAKATHRTQRMNGKQQASFYVVAYLRTYAS